MNGYLRVVRWDDPHAFVREAVAFLLQDEPANCLMVAMLSKPESFQGAYLATIHDDDGLRGVSVETPLKLLLSRMNEDAAHVFAAAVFKTNPHLNEVLGPRPEVDTFATTWSSLTGRPARPRRTERIYQLDTVKPLPDVRGTMRRINEEDRAVVVPWIQAMNAEIGDAVDPTMAEEIFDRHREGQTLFLWEHNGPVSMTADAARSPNTGRVSLVYTPPEQRRRGYASALVASLSQQVLDSGTRLCVLYTDIANPTTNHIYQEIGYRPVCDAQEYSLRG